MGCDIHVYVEKQNSDGVWEPVYSQLRTCGQCEGTLHDLERSRCANCECEEQDHDEVTKRCFTGPLTLSMRYVGCYCTKSWGPPGKEQVWEHRWYRGRNYDLFAVLANVRGNGDDFTEERGVPDDASPQYKQEADCVDWHSHTWYTVDEMVNQRPKGYWRKFPDWGKMLSRLRELSANPKKPDDIRVVFFFDN